MADVLLAVTISFDGHEGAGVAARVVDDLRQHGRQLCVGAITGDARTELAVRGQWEHFRADVGVVVRGRDVREVELFGGHARLEELQANVHVAIAAAGALRHDLDGGLMPFRNFGCLRFLAKKRPCGLNSMYVRMRGAGATTISSVTLISGLD